MVLTYFKKRADKFEIQTYRSPKDRRELRKGYVPFSGSPQKHPYDSEKFILISDPYSGNTFFYEFRKEDVSYIEELPNLVTLDGETVTMARIWIRKNSVAIRSTPFVVEDIWPRPE